MQQDENQDNITPDASNSEADNPSPETEKIDYVPVPGKPWLRPKPWTKADGSNPPPKPPSKLGKRNRKTIIKELLDMAASKAWRDKHKEVGWEYEPQQLRDQVLASLALKALGGDIAAINTLLDSEFGKIPQINTDADKPEKSHDEILRELIEPKKQIEGDAVEGKEED